MPATSKAQFRLMQAMLHGAGGGKGKPSKAVAKDFIDATPKGAYKNLPEKKAKKPKS